MSIKKDREDNHKKLEFHEKEEEEAQKSKRLLLIPGNRFKLLSKGFG